MKCPKCGQEAVGNFCSNCGSPLANDMTRRESGEPTEKKLEKRQDKKEAEETKSARTKQDERTEKSGTEQNGQKNPESQEGQKRGEERREQERRQAQEDARRDRESASRRRQDARRSSSASKDDKRDGKQQKQMEKRIHALESERERSERQKDRMERSHQRELERQSREAERTRRAAERSEHAQNDSKDGPSMLDVTTAGVTGVVVLMARVMQAACCLLMAGITWANAKAFRYGGDDLGYIGTMISEQNYGLGLYVGIGSFLVLMGLIWCLWILSGRREGGKVRLKKYDTGRGFIPFVLILILVLAAGPAAYLIPKDAGSLQPIADGGYAALEAINANHGFLLFCSIGGAILSFIRKMLLV